MRRLTALEIIQEFEATYVAHPENRGIGKDTYCVYKAKNGNMCAVGRCLTQEAMESFADFKGDLDSALNELNITDFDLKLKAKYRGQKTDFWHDLQEYHDRQYYWDAAGLTEQGKEAIATFKELHS
jgi:hypothetical protein